MSASASSQASWPAAFDTPRLRVRALVDADAAFIAALHAHAGVMHHIGPALDADAARRVAARILAGSRRAPPSIRAWMLWTDAPATRVGLMTVVPAPPAAAAAGACDGEFGLLFAPDAMGRGFATEAVAGLLGCAPPGAIRLTARHRPSNAAVRRLMQRLGFVNEGEDAGYAWWGSAARTA